MRDPTAPLSSRWAHFTWGLLGWAIANDGTLYDRLVHHPETGPDTRTVGPALWLLLYDTATTGPLPAEHWMRLDLADLAARLNPDDQTTVPLRDRLKTRQDPEVWEALNETETPPCSAPPARRNGFRPAPWPIWSCWPSSTRPALPGLRGRAAPGPDVRATAGCSTAAQ
ncbi:hypothetical protein [Streptacidiphilus sp. EB103A]|uniref:hypothetical protein n=1 Tax=Streptacidiphilus sp. EB103A TaxID=3156275 RepID=UPI0035199A0D